jgi:hypothetical protein
MSNPLPDWAAGSVAPQCGVDMATLSRDVDMKQTLFLFMFCFWVVKKAL